MDHASDARGSLPAWLERRGRTLGDYVFPSRIDHSDYVSTREYARLVDEWVTSIGVRREEHGTHSLRRTKASVIYKVTSGAIVAAMRPASNGFCWKDRFRVVAPICRTAQIVERWQPRLLAGAFSIRPFRPMEMKNGYVGI